MDDLKALLKSEFSLGYDSPHAWWHWKRVEAYGLYLCRHTEANPKVVHWFAWFHDSCRQDEGRDPGHGRRGAEKARRLRDRLPLDDVEMRLLVAACVDHESGYTSRDVTIGACWDADRLDLDRVLIEPNPRLMSTPAGRQLAARPARDRWAQAGLEGPPGPGGQHRL